MADLYIGMKRTALITFANEILAQCLESEGRGERDQGICVTRDIKPNNNGGILTIQFSNDDMEHYELDDSDAFYDYED